LVTLDFDLGEKKYVTAIVRTENENDTIVINKATWELYTAPGKIYVPKQETHNTTNIEKECLINGDEVAALIELNEKGTFILEFTVEIAPERIKEKVIIKVS
jgi:hypothetical protein